MASLVPAIHAFERLILRKSWVAGTRLAMTGLCILPHMQA
jgi:hypothetical protein